MSQTRKIYLFRHGKTHYNEEGKFTGWDNPHLSAKGIKEANIVARKLKTKKFEVAIHSHLLRSKETLQIVLKYHPECGKIIEDDRMIERNYGVLNGTTHQSFIDKVGKKLIKLDVATDMISSLPKKERKQIEKFLGQEEYNLIHRGYDVAPLKGESFAMVEKRVSGFIKDLTTLVKKEKCSVAIAAHGNSIRIFRKIMEKASVKNASSWYIPHDKVYTYSIKI